MDDDPIELTDIGDFSFLAVRPGYVMLQHDVCGRRVGTAHTLSMALSICIEHRCDDTIPTQRDEA